MDGGDDGSGSADYALTTAAPTPGPGAEVSLWVVFGVCVIVCLVVNLLYNCYSSVEPNELNEALVNAVDPTKGNDESDEDEEVFGRPALSLTTAV